MRTRVSLLTSNVGYPRGSAAMAGATERRGEASERRGKAVCRQAGRGDRGRHRGDGDWPGAHQHAHRAVRPLRGPAPGAEDQVREESVRALRRRRFPPEKVALAVLRAVLRDQAIVPVNAESRVVYVLSRLAPATLRALAALEAKRSQLLASASGRG